MSALSKELSDTLHWVFSHASDNGHEYVTVEHLLLGLLRDRDATEVLIACGADLKSLNIAVDSFLKDNSNEISPVKNNTHEVRPTMAVQRILSRASMHASNASRKFFSGADVLVALFSEEKSNACYFLSKHDVDYQRVVDYLSHGVDEENSYDDDSNIEGAIQSSNTPSNARATASRGSGSDKKADANLLVNLNEEAQAGRIDPLIGRKEETEGLMRILLRRRKNNPLLIGEPGVGKTAVAEGLALAINEGNVPESFKDCVVYSLDVGALLAGTRYRGDFEERFKNLLAKLAKQAGAILFIDEVHTVIGAGAAHGSAIDISNLLKPVLGKGRLRCIGATTYQEYRRVFERDRALARRFQKLDVAEPSVEASYEVLKGLKKHYEEFHNVNYTDSALHAAVDLSDRYINMRFLPDKAIDVMDEAGARISFLMEKDRKINTEVIEEVVAQMARVPARSVSDNDKDRLAHLDTALKLNVFGQDTAIESLVSAVKLSRAGLREDNKTIGAYLFAGPTGVGKTEVSRCLAKAMGVELLRFDMSEYQERHTVSRLIGAPPGYVGFNEGGELTDAVHTHPYSVILLDEIEKAHPEIYNILLQVMDNGCLTDSNGRKTDFRNTIVIMTSNIGAADMSRRSMGFAEQDHRSDVHRAIEKRFTPEFRNRLDATVIFRPLSKEVNLSVVDKFIADLQTRLEARQVILKLNKAARHWLVEHGYNVQMGARPMHRLIQEKIKQPLADALLFGSLSENGGVVRVDVKDKELVLAITPKAAQTKLDKQLSKPPIRSKETTDKN